MARTDRTSLSFRAALELLPLDGSTVSIGDLKKKAGRRWRTVQRRLAEAQKEGLVRAEWDTAGGVPKKLLAFDIAGSLRQHGPRSYLEMQRLFETTFEETFSRYPPELRSSLQHRDLLQFSLKSHLEALSSMTTLALMQAAQADTKAGATRQVELVVDHVFRRYVRELAASVWETRKESGDVLRTILAGKRLGKEGQVAP